MSPVSRGTPSGDAYLALRRLALQEGKQTDHYFSHYALERFLARLLSSNYEVCSDVWAFISPLVETNKAYAYGDRAKHAWLKQHPCR